MRGKAQQFLVDVVAAYRLTRLVTADVIAEPIRTRIIETAYTTAGRYGAAKADMPARGLDPTEPDAWARYVMDNDPRPPKIATLITCRWCAGMWISMGVIAARALVPSLWDPVAHTLSLSAGAALIAGLEKDG